MTCFQCWDIQQRPHEWPFPGYYWSVRMSFGTWLVHRLVHSAPGLVGFLVRNVGILDADEEGDTIYWRWGFWRGKQKRALRQALEYERARKLLDSMGTGR